LLHPNDPNLFDKPGHPKQAAVKAIQRLVGAGQRVPDLEIELGMDLFGAWMVEMSYGRIGASGRTKVRSYSTTEEAQAQVRACLRKRATAPRRIGVAYRVRRLDGSTAWLQSKLGDRLGAWHRTCVMAEPRRRSDIHHRAD
jgi:hypothetical protein